MIGNVSHKYQIIIQSLLEHSTIKEAAASINVAEITIHRYMKRKDFQEALQKARNVLMKTTISRLQVISHQAIDTLVQIMNDSNSKDHARLSAAKTILELSFKGTELLKLEEIEQRLSQIESGDID